MGGKIYRYSVAYYNSGYDKTFRAEMISEKKLSNKQIEPLLFSSLQNRVSSLNSGLRKMFNRSAYIGYESEEVGRNDLNRYSQLNKIYISIS